MITEQDLQAAIAECEGQRNPNANTCIKLAAFYTIRDHLFGGGTDGDHFTDAVRAPMYSAAPAGAYESDTEFAQAVRGWSVERLMPIMDELMSAVSVLNPSLYKAVLRKVLEN